jgi:Lon protease-like protein
MEPRRIPLFPLELVLFPGTLLPLHIFEPRYRQMIALCRARELKFGVVLVKGNGIARTGCTAEIVEVAREYPDGRLDILTMGRLAFHIVEVVEEQAYAEADVEYLGEEPFQETLPGGSLLRLYARCHELALGSKPEPVDADSYESFAYHVAGELPLDLDYKQSLLEMRNEMERRQNLESALGKWLVQYEQVARTRRTAGGNGHRQVN